jgi:hypothetical protein
MQTNVETRVEHTLTVRMTETEWREVLNDPKKFFAEIRKELEELKFATPEKGKSTSKKVYKSSNPQICPGCGKIFVRLGNHIKFCEAAKSGVPAADSSSRPETESPTDEPTASSASGS